MVWPDKSVNFVWNMIFPYLLDLLEVAERGSLGYANIGTGRNDEGVPSTSVAS